MGTYVPNTKSQQHEMLQEIRPQSMDDLFSSIPEEVS